MRRAKTYPRYHSNCGLSRHFTLQQALSLNAGRRENLKSASAFRLGSDGFFGCILLPYTNRQLSGRVLARTVFVTAFFVLPILYHVLDKKSNVFMRENKNLFSVQFSIPLRSKNWRNCLLTKTVVCGLMTIVYIAKTMTEKFPLPSVPESRRLV